VIDKMTKVIHANPDLVKHLKAKAAILGITMQEATNKAIAQYINGGDNSDTNS